MIDQRQQFLKQWPLAVLKVGHDGDSGVVRDAGGAELPGQAPGINDEHAGGLDERRRWVAVVRAGLTAPEVEDGARVVLFADDDDGVDGASIVHAQHVGDVHAGAVQFVDDEGREFVAAQRAGVGATAAHARSGQQGRRGQAANSDAHGAGRGILVSPAGKRSTKRASSTAAQPIPSTSQRLLILLPASHLHVEDVSAPPG